MHELKKNCFLHVCKIIDVFCCVLWAGYLFAGLLQILFDYLANPPFLFVKFGAYHVITIEVVLPFIFALNVELNLLRGLLQYI